MGERGVREVVKLCSSKFLGDQTAWEILTRLSSHTLLVEQWNWRGERGERVCMLYHVTGLAMFDRVVLCTYTVHVVNLKDMEGNGNAYTSNLSTFVTHT